jgi:3-deoxy-manno-octulosonate cytidylyltransferase (CMP-KDO synthetase)
VVAVVKNLEPLARAGATLVVATDDQSVVAACATHGVLATMTRPDHPSGTDRCAEVAARPGLGGDRTHVLNVQGDEPTVDCQDLLALMELMMRTPGADCGTLVFRETDRRAATDPNAVKCVVAKDGRALYFSRAPIPYERDAKAHGGAPADWWLHLGVYAFRKDRLADFVKLPPSRLEQIEKLEQLRALENGWQILTHPARTRTRGIATPEDLEAARARLR